MTPQLSEVWRVSLGRSGPVHIPQLLDLRPDGTIVIADLAAGVILEAGPEQGEPPAGRPLPPELVSTIAARSARTSVPRDEAVSPERILALPSGGVLVAQPPVPIEGGAPERMVGFVLHFPPDGRSPDTAYAAGVQVLGGDEFTEWPRPGTTRPLMAIGPGGAVALAGATARYRIDVLRNDLTDSLVVCRKAPAFPLTDSERGLVELPDSPPGLADLLRESRKLKPPAAFGRIFIGAGGRLWVQRDRPEPQRLYRQPEGATYDVFEAGGRYLGDVRAPGRSLLFGDAGGLIYGAEATDGGENALVAYALE